MVSTAAHSEGQVAKEPRKRRKAPAEGVEVDRRDPPSASLVLLNDEVPLAFEGADDPPEPLDQVEQSGDVVWDEESEALRQAARTPN
jgi:hypothetical protein